MGKSKYTYEYCKELAKLYDRRVDFFKTGGAYQISLKNKWIDEFFPPLTEEEKIIRRKEIEQKYRNSEKGKKARIEYQISHKKEKSEYDKIYREKHKEKIAKYNKEYKAKNKEHLINQSTEYCKNYRKGEKGRAVNLSYHYKVKDKNKGFNTDETVNSEWIVKNIFTNKCIYCGDNDYKHLGCDRIDNSKGHIDGNIVCSCGICNCERETKKMSVEEFIEYRKANPITIKVIYNGIEYDSEGNVLPLKKKKFIEKKVK